MKKISFTLLLILSLFTQCRLFTCDEVNYIFKNETEYNVKIIGYLNNITDTITIFSQTSITRTKGTGECKDGTVGYFNFYQEADSAYIIFNNSKIIKYYNKNFNEKNILNYNSSLYEINCKKNKGCDYEYIITNVDYLNADTIIIN